MEMKNEKDIFFENNGLYAHTSHMVNGDAFIIAEASVENYSSEDQEVWIDIHMHQLIDNQKVQMDEEPGIKAAGAIKLFVPAGECQTARTQICVEDAAVWSIAHPILYVVEAVLYKAVPEGEALPNPRLLAGMALEEPHGMKMLDFQETHFGIRTVTVDAKNGFCLNGEMIKLKGGRYENSEAGKKTDGSDRNSKVETQLEDSCDSQAVFEQQYQLVTKYKENGYNAILIEHCQASEHLMECCSRLGVLVLEAVSDGESIRCNRNSPAVVMWITENMQVDEIRKFDSNRYIGGICDAAVGMREGAFDRMLWNDATEVICASWSVCGYPDVNSNYREAHALFPNRVMFAVSDEPEAIWEEVQKYPYVIGALTKNA